MPSQSKSSRGSGKSSGSGSLPELALDVLVGLLSSRGRSVTLVPLVLGRIGDLGGENAIRSLTAKVKESDERVGTFVERCAEREYRRLRVAKRGGSTWQRSEPWTTPPGSEGAVADDAVADDTDDTTAVATDGTGTQSAPKGDTTP